MTQQKKPNFIIIGAMKSATTSLYTYLKQHPDVFMTNIKEPMFFNNFQNNNNFKILGKKKNKITTFQQYYTLFDAVKNERAIGEASPAYISNEDCPRLIQQHLPHAKIIAVLRQPVARAYSNFLHARRAGREPIDDFETAFNKETERKTENWSPLYHYKGKGYYTEQLERYFTLFPKENIKVLIFEDLVKDPTKTTQEVFKFLNIDNSFVPDTSKKSNVSGIPKGLFGLFIMKLRYYNLIPNIQFSNYLPGFIILLIFNSAYKKANLLAPELKKRLTHTFYKEDILKLEKLIGKDLKHWLC
tara:strand:- start:237 stop:1139 length:903 start_codon:yes stop_codon:yes gene_type:complete